MHTLHLTHPQYGFDQHKGYPTATHMAALHKHGPLPEHRYSFGPVAREAAARGIVTDTYVDRAKAAAAQGTSKAAPKSKGAKKGAAAPARKAAGDARPTKRVTPPPTSDGVPKKARAAGKDIPTEAPAARVTRSRSNKDV